jgi:hypothetical protein
MPSMSDRELWQQVYLASIQSGMPGWAAKDAANEAIKSQPKQ